MNLNDGNGSCGCFGALLSSVLLLIGWASASYMFDHPDESEVFCEWIILSFHRESAVKSPVFVKYFIYARTSSWGWRAADDRSTFWGGLAPRGHAGDAEGGMPSRIRHYASYATVRTLATAFRTTNGRGGVGGWSPLSVTPEVSVVLQDGRSARGSVAQDEGPWSTTVSKRRA